jgi:hypothetical protein
MSALLTGIGLFAALLVGFGIFAFAYAVFELAYQAWRRARRQPELLPDPEPRAIVRRRGWQVPM